MGCITSRNVVHLDSKENESTPPSQPVLIQVREPPVKKVVVVPKGREKPLVLRNVSSSDGSSDKNDGTGSEADSHSTADREEVGFARNKGQTLPDSNAVTPLNYTGPGGAGDSDRDVQQTKVTVLEGTYDVKSNNEKPGGKGKTEPKRSFEEKTENKSAVAAKFETESKVLAKSACDYDRDSNMKEGNMDSCTYSSEEPRVEAETQTEVHREAWGEPNCATSAEGDEAEATDEMKKEDTDDAKTTWPKAAKANNNKTLIKPKTFPRRTQAEQKEILQQLREEGILSSVTGVRQGGVAFFVPSQSEFPEAQARPPRVLERLKPYKSHRRGHYTLEEKLLIAEILRDEKLKQHGAMARRFEQRRRKLLEDKNSKSSEEGEEDFEATPEEAGEEKEGSRLARSEEWQSLRVVVEEAPCENPSVVPDS